MKTETLKPGEQRQHFHPLTYFVVRRWFGNDHPAGRPYFCAGRFYASEEAAVRGFDGMTKEAPAVEDRRYAMAEASFGEEA
jgi:hypothetical protein